MLKKEISKRTQDQGSSLRYSGKEKTHTHREEKKSPNKKHHTMQVIIATVKEPPDCFFPGKKNKRNKIAFPIHFQSAPPNLLLLMSCRHGKKLIIQMVSE